MVNEYFKAQYNLKELTPNSKSFELVMLEKLYGKEINIPDWYENLKVDYSTDGGIDFIVIDIDGKIIPLLENDNIPVVLEEILFDKKITEKKISSLYDENNVLITDDLIELLLKTITKKNAKLKVDFIQSKSGNAIQERVLIKIKDTLDDLIIKNNFSSVRYTEKLKINIKFIKKLIEKISINDGAIEINFNYITSDQCTPKSIDSHMELVNSITDIMKRGFNHSHVNFELLYGEKLIDKLEQSCVTKLSLKIDKTEMMYNHNLFCIGLITLKELENFVSFRNNIDNSLFDGNVRDSYNNSSKINKEIKETLISNISINDFWWLNNGITIICESLNLDGDKLYLEAPQIVNGLQSVFTIFDTLKSGIRLNENKKIMIRILVERDPDNIDTIIKTTNTQNPVDEYLLKSTKKIHKDIEIFFLGYDTGYYYDRRKNYYKNINKDKEKIFDIKYTFKTYASIFLGIPSQVRTSTKTNFRNKHNVVFNEEVNKLAYIYSDLLDRNIQKVLRKTDIDNEFKNINGVSIVTYSLHLAFIYTAIIKSTIDFTDKYISNTDLRNVVNIDEKNIDLLKSIDILKTCIERYPNENKVYLARTPKFEEEIKEEIKKKLNLIKDGKEG